jgi:hypothetical protein
MLSTGRASDQPNHSRSIEARDSVRTDVGTACLADRLPVEHHRDRCVPRRSRVHHHIHLAGSEGKDDPASALLEFEVLA